MRRSIDRILTTHAGALPRPEALDIAFDHRLDDPSGFTDGLPGSVADVVRRQRDVGTDCGLGGRVHPELAWAKLQVLSDGAALASDRFWRN